MSGRGRGKTGVGLWLVVCSYALFSLGYVNQAVAEDSTTKMVHLAYVNYPPYYGAELADGGPLGQIIREAFTLAGYQVTREQLPWARAYQWTLEGNYDALYSAWYREDREEHFAYSEALLANEVVLFGKHESIEQYAKSGSLEGLTVGVVRGYAMPESLDSKKLALQYVTTDRQNIEKLVKGYIDLTIIDRALARYLLSRYFSEHTRSFSSFDLPLQREPQYLIFSRESAGFSNKLEDFNRAYRTMQASGRVDEILRQHDMID